MKNQLLKVFEGKRQKPTFPVTMIENWLLPSWFIKQSNLLYPGYVFGNYQFANICFRNWTALSNINGASILIDREGTISFPQFGVSIEIWVNEGQTFLTPGRFLRTDQTIEPEFPCIETRSQFNNGICNSRLFLLERPRNTCIGIELSLDAPEEFRFNNFLVCLVIRPYDHDGLSGIRRLEYKNKCLKVNNIELLQFETEPKIIYCTHAGLGDVTEYLRNQQNSYEIMSRHGHCTGLIGYLIRPADQTGVKLIAKPDSLKIFPHRIREFSSKWYWESKQNWLNQCVPQHNMLLTDSEIDWIYRVNLNYLMMFNSYSSELAEIDKILTLNRLGLFEQSRIYLLKTLKKVRWDGTLSYKSLTTEKLIWALLDYYLFTDDFSLVNDHWQILKRMGFWLLQNLAIVPGAPGREGTKDLIWICASLKALWILSEIKGDFENLQSFHQQYRRLWTDILSFWSRIFKDNSGKSFRNKLQVSESLANLALSYPLQLFQRNERFVQDWLKQVIEELTFKGGVISPMEFQGVDLKLTTHLGMILLREERNYDKVFEFLHGTISPTGTWPDRIHPAFGGGIGATGHSQEVGCRFLLLLRNIMVMEEGEVLYLLPGIFTSKLWVGRYIELNNSPTIFGEISLKCQNIGNIVQIEFRASFRKKPQEIRLILNKGDYILYSDVAFIREGGYVRLDSDFKIVRFRRGQP